MNCKCGHSLPEDAHFCPACGQPMTDVPVVSSLPDSLNTQNETYSATSRSLNTERILNAACLALILLLGLVLGYAWFSVPAGTEMDAATRMAVRLPFVMLTESLTALIILLLLRAFVTKHHPGQWLFIIWMLLIPIHVLAVSPTEPPIKMEEPGVAGRDNEQATLQANQPKLLSIFSQVMDDGKDVDQLTHDLFWSLIPPSVMSTTARRRELIANLSKVMTFQKAFWGSLRLSAKTHRIVKMPGFEDAMRLVSVGDTEIDKDTEAMLQAAATGTPYKFRSNPGTMLITKESAERKLAKLDARSAQLDRLFDPIWRNATEPRIKMEEPGVAGTDNEQATLQANQPKLHSILSQVPETTASGVFAADSPSIVVVKAIDESDHVLALGSGVVIARDVVVSNCHVFTENGTSSASVFYRNKQFPAKLRYADPEHDLCSLTVPGLGAPPVKMRGTSAVEVGEDAYAIGAPEGYELTLSNGIISSLRHVPGGTIIQMTTPISPGSSGGGLFDSEGRLIGITSYYGAKGQQLNFALPSEWIDALPQRGKSTEELTQIQSKSGAAVQQGIRAALSGDYAMALAILGPLAEQGDARAQFQMGVMCSNGQGIPQDSAKALYWYHLAAAQDLAAAQYNIGVMYGAGKGVPQDEAKAIEWYSKPAAQELAEAQYNIGLTYLQGRPGIKSDYVKAFYWFSKAAAQGKADAQLGLGAIYDGGLGIAKNYAHAAEWFRRAAEQGLAGAQALLGSSYEYGRGVPQSYHKAFDWYNKAAAQGNDIAETNLGSLYGAGRGVPQDNTKAAYWYGKAAEQGMVVAQASLGARYAAGIGVPQDFVLSIKWLILAQAGGDEDSRKLLIDIEQISPSAQVAEAQRLAREWWSEHHK